MSEEVEKIRKLDPKSCVKEVRAHLEAAGAPDAPGFAKFVARQNGESKYFELGSNMEIEESTLLALEYVKVEEEGEVKDREASWLEAGDDDEYEEDLSWFHELSRVEREDETYFTIINDSRTVMKAGSQVWNCYGNRTNQFLLL